MKIGFIGVGKMASAIISGIKQTEHEIIISGSSLMRSQEIAKNLGLKAASSHQELVEQVDLVILGIKPQIVETVLSELDIKKPIMSMAAGITLDRLAQLTDSSLPLIRIMPNMNAQILQSTTGICYNPHVSDDLKTTIRQITDSFGTTFELAEKDFDTFTALAGSSPAYIYLFIEAMAKAGVKNGLTKAQSLDIVTQTVMASAQNLMTSEDNLHVLIDKICSPGGTTIAGLMNLEKNGLTHSVVSAIDATIDKAKKM
ncbi:pyrroline-5-carboxylate reductase [Streptococcus thoraltensis]|uniref:pyrroline-5-carboxylate reductase n=1 Tax=Streptococcus thoraltensis TaxID=55085 RepID=UPI000364CFB8|nr:pyrroline-5-carboxylate reductase [Streptococcus thoraltensis]MDY4761769.1 pyrroline-5-carboxylate reductase [Streptococcus thoraltensis]